LAILHTIPFTIPFTIPLPTTLPTTTIPLTVPTSPEPVIIPTTSKPQSISTAPKSSLYVWDASRILSNPTSLYYHIKPFSQKREKKRRQRMRVVA